MKFKKTLLAATAAMTLASTAAYADIVIAVAGPMTGQYAALGEQMKRGADQAVADLNAAGGILGEKIKLEVGDDA
jgi:branched-chain amino acid transport system substrate-binding protein